MPTLPARERGLTLIELMVTLAVLAILLAIGIPNFQNSIANSRLSSTSIELATALAHARMEAIRRGTRVTVCASTDGNQCANAGPWSQGWITFSDTTRAGGTASLDAGETLIASLRLANSDLIITGSGNVSQYISFGPDGRTWTIAGTAQTGTLRVCSQSATNDNSRVRDLVLIGSGRVITEKTTGVNSACAAP